MMPGKDVKWPARRSMKEPGNDPTEDRVTRHYEPGGTRSGRGLLDRGQSRHEDADTEEGAEQVALFCVKRKSGRGKGRELEGEDREQGLSSEGSASQPRPRTLENQA
mgnify:CR=1 FL=1